MSDFSALEWTKQDVKGDVAQALRKDVRTHRRERGRGGHRFGFNYLKTLWAASDGLHAVCSHIDDPVWQMWYRHPEDGWILISWHLTRREAQAEVENGHPDTVDRPARVIPGLNVVAGWYVEPYRKASSVVEFTMRVPCSSEKTAAAIEEAFSKLGCITERELVDAAVA